MGIDPGTTAAYAILDTSGNVIKIRSGKDLSKEKMVSEITKYGDVSIVSSDVNPAPSTVKFIASSFSAKLVYPDTDMSVNEKKKLAKLGGNINNSHERDALGAAFRAFKVNRDLISRVKRRTGSDEEDVMKLVLSGKVNRISSAIQMVQDESDDLNVNKKRKRSKSLFGSNDSGFRYSTKYPPIKKSKPPEIPRVLKKKEPSFDKESFFNWLKRYKERKTR